MSRNPVQLNQPEHEGPLPEWYGKPPRKQTLWERIGAACSEMKNQFDKRGSINIDQIPRSTKARNPVRLDLSDGPK